LEKTASFKYTESQTIHRHLFADKTDQIQGDPGRLLILSFTNFMRRAV